LFTDDVVDYIREGNAQWPIVGWKMILGLSFADFLANRMFYSKWTTNED
jgi:hypothetical protein